MLNEFETIPSIVIQQKVLINEVDHWVRNQQKTVKINQFCVCICFEKANCSQF